jgi:hypothetical protein
LLSLMRRILVMAGLIAVLWPGAAGAVLRPDPAPGAGRAVVLPGRYACGLDFALTLRLCVKVYELRRRGLEQAGQLAVAGWPGRCDPRVYVLSVFTVCAAAGPQRRAGPSA